MMLKEVFAHNEWDLNSSQECAAITNLKLESISPKWQ